MKRAHYFIGNKIDFISLQHVPSNTHIFSFNVACLKEISFLHHSMSINSYEIDVILRL